MNKELKWWLYLALPVAAAILVIWLPFGFKLIGLIEEWDVLGLFSEHGLFFLADRNSPLAAHAARPLTVSPHALAYWLDPNTFDFWHILLIGGLLIKGVASSYIAWKATGSRKWAVITGVILLVYPADTMQLSFRSLHINSALSLTLLASALFIAGYDRKRGVASISLGVLAALLLFLASCMYEATLVMIPLPLLVIFVREGFRSFFLGSRAKADLVLIWIAGAGAYAAYVIAVAGQTGSYQASIAGDTNTGFRVLISSFPKLFSVGALRGLFGGWFDAYRIARTEYSNYGYPFVAVLAVCIATAISVRCMRQGGALHEQNSVDSALPYRMLVVGLALVLAGYMPFLLLRSHQVISQRTFLWVAPGGAIFWVGLLLLISRRVRVVSALLAILLLALGLGAQLFQMEHYVRIAEKQRALLKTIVENFDGQLDGKTLILRDKSNQLGHTWMFLPVGLPYALSYLYGHPIAAVQICHVPSMEWQQGDALGRKGTCSERDNEWVFASAEPVEGPGYVPASTPAPIRVAKRDSVVLDVDPDGPIAQNPALDSYRQQLRRGDSPVARRYRGILKHQPRSLGIGMFRSRLGESNYHWDFGDWWSLELPIRGSGWREAEWQVNGFTQKASAWRSGEKSSLYFDIVPSAGVYSLKVNFETLVSDAIRQSLRIGLNSTELHYKWIAPNELEAEIEPGVLRNGVNEIAFISAIDRKYYGHSAKVDWIDLHGK